MTPFNPKPKWAAALLALAALAAYAGSFSGAFVFDDLPSIRDNPAIARLWPLWPVVSPPQSLGLTTAGRPLLSLSFAINRALGGAHVWGYHAVNLLIHVLAGWALFGIVRRTLSRTRADDRATTTAFVAALIWILHPIQTESVAYVVQRAESMMGLFYLLTLYGFVRSVRADRESAPAAIDRRAGGTGSAPAATPGQSGAGAEATRPPIPKGWAALSVLACLAGMATKEVMVSAPVMVLLYDRTFVTGSFRGALKQRRSFYLCLAATWIPLGALVASTGGNRGGTSGAIAAATVGQYWPTQLVAIPHYLRLFLWPHPLVFEYGAFWIHNPREALPGGLVVAGFAAFTAWALWRRPAWGFLGAWFFAILAPTSLVPGAVQMIAEHRAYLALAPVAVAAAVALGRLGMRNSLLAGLAIGIALGGATRRRIEDYATEFSLWNDTVAKRPNNAVARTNLGDVLRRGGHIQEAIAQSSEAVRIRPDLPEARYNLASALLQAGRFQEAASQYDAALKLRPRFAEAHLAYAAVLLQLGRPQKSMTEYGEALRLAPGSFEAHYNFGNALFQLGRPEEAAHHYGLALEINPDSVEALYNSGNVLIQLGRTAEGIVRLSAAVRLRPDLADAHFNLAGALASSGRPADALREYEEVLRLNPSDQAARQAAAQLRAALGPR